MQEKEEKKRNKMNNDMNRMLNWLTSYRNAYYEWLYLNSKTGLGSPAVGSEGKGYSPTVESRYNHDLERKEELLSIMKPIEDFVESIREIDQDAYRIAYWKFIRFKTLEEISDMLHYSLSHLKHTLYPKCKMILLKECTQLHPDQ